MARGSADLTRERLLGAAHDLFVERAGRVASVSEICARAEVNVAMVKYCFGSKDGLLDALLERVLQRLTGEFERLSHAPLDPTAKLRRHVAEIVRNYVRYPYVNRLMTERLLSAEPDAVDRISASFAIPARDWYAVLLREGRERDGWREMDPTLFFFTVVGVCEFLFSARPLLERAFDAKLDDALLERFTAHVTELVVAGMQPAPAAEQEPAEPRAPSPAR
ncbi:MAG: TetR family transcriptional regulator [Conexibacter sp.]|nr:TetR family transcriptional regulator [Conexibacter sp.]